MKRPDLKLTIELVPATVWFSSIYQIYRRSGRLDEWQEIKRELYEKEGRRCWICGAQNTTLEAHEFWEYDDVNHVQRLKAIHHLCSMCHKIKHVGYWCYTEEGRRRLAKAGLSREDLIRHFCRVNGCSREVFEEHERETFKVWRKRSQHEWKQDFGRYDPYAKEKRERPKAVRKLKLRAIP